MTAISSTQHRMRQYRELFFILILSLWQGVVSLKTSRMMHGKLTYFAARTNTMKRVWMSSPSSSSMHSVAGFNLIGYLNEHLMGNKRDEDESSGVSVEFHAAEPRSTFEENKHYLLLVDLGVRTVADIDLPYITDHIPELKRLLRKMKSTGTFDI